MSRFRYTSSINDPPPPYPTSDSVPTPPATRVPYDPLTQFRRYIIEIMGFTFDADFSLLNHAFGQMEPTTTSPTTSILTTNERTKLLVLSTLINKIKGKVSERGIQWLTIPSTEREAVADAVIRPALYLGLPASYILELFGTYTTHECNPTKRSLSLISQRRPYYYSFWRRLAFLGPFNFVLGNFTNELWSHAHVISIVAPNDEVSVLLGNAMYVYQKEVLWIENADHMGMVFEGDDWKRVKRAVILREDEERIRSKRWSREWDRANDRAKADSARYCGHM